MPAAATCSSLPPSHWTQAGLSGNGGKQQQQMGSIPISPGFPGRSGEQQWPLVPLGCVGQACGWALAWTRAPGSCCTRIHTSLHVGGGLIQTLGTC